MANELRAYYNGSATLYAIIRRASDMYVWNGSAFAAWSDGSIGSYDIPLTSQGGDAYSANFPSGITTSGIYYVDYYVQAGGSPATSDYRLPSGESINWTGTSAEAGGPGGGVSTITLETAREWVQYFARNVAGDTTTYSATNIDRAIAAVLDDFVHYTKCTQTTATVTLTEDDDDLPAFPTGMRPEWVRRAYIAGEGELETIPHADLLQKQIDDSDTGLPEFIAFTSATTGKVFPTPDDGYTLTLVYVSPPTSFTPGTGSPGSVTFNVPDHYLRNILTYGATAMLQHAQPEHAYASETWQKYLVYRNSLRGLGGTGAKIAAREGATF